MAMVLATALTSRSFHAMIRTMNQENEINRTVEFLESDRTIRALAADAYWPKWDGPWWQMLLLHEMGETQRIPERAIDAMVEKVSQYPVKFFPFRESELPPGVDARRDTPCHCQLGNLYQVLAARGVDVDRELPWIRPWFMKYQMADGGLTCDNEAYLVEDEVPSSMVGTIAVFEAVLLYTPREWTIEEKAFLESGAKFLLGRRLVDGSPTRHNSSERESASKWKDLCFPRFYFYDVLRGLSALAIWAEKTGSRIPREAVTDAMAAIESKFPDGEVRIGRRAFEGTRTIAPDASGEWQRADAVTPPLLESVSQVGALSPFLSRQWRETRERLSEHIS